MEKVSLPTVLALIADEELRTDVKTALARGGIVALPAASVAACAAAIESDTSVGMVITDTPARDALHFSAMMRRAAGRREVVVAFITDNLDMTGPEGEAVYCVDDFQSDPQPFVDAIRARLVELVSLPAIFSLTQTVTASHAVLTRVEATLLDALKGPDKLMRVSDVEARLAAPSLFGATFFNWWNNRDVLLKWAIGGLTTVLASVAMAGYAGAKAKLDDVPRLRQTVETHEVAIHDAARRQGELWRRIGSMPASKPTTR